MERATIQRQLAEAEQHVSQGIKNIALQRELLADLEREGRDSSEARSLLKTFLDQQAKRVQHRDALLRELAKPR
jgi:hypothetical protein